MMSQTVYPIQYRALNDAQCAQVAESIYRVLENTGCVVHSAYARELLAKAGCTVEGELVKIPASVTKWAIEKAPSTVTVYDREGNPAMVLEPGKVHFGPGITITQIEDLDTAAPRDTVKQDSVNAATLLDALDNVSWVSACTSPSDVDAAIVDLAELHAILPNTHKPVMYWAQSMKSLEYQFEMFEAVAGSAERLQEKPFMMNLVCPMDPLTHTEEAMEQIIYLAKKQALAVYMAGIGLGLTGPASLAGAISVGLADTLVGLIVCQLANPGAPFIVSRCTDNVDMRTMNIVHSNPEMSLANAGMADVLRYMGLPFCSNYVATNCDTFSQVAAFDKSVQAYMAILTGTNMVMGMGSFKSGSYMRFSDFVFSNEVVDFLKILHSGIEISEETLAEDVIDEVGPGGVFFSEEHTLDRIHDFWRADLLQTNATAQEIDKALNQRVKEILAKGPQHPLAPEIVEKLNGIMERAEKDILNK